MSNDRRMLLRSSEYMPLIRYQPSSFGTLNIPAPPSIKIPTIDKITCRRTGKYVSSNLSQKLLGDVVVGTGVTLAVTPFLTVVDKAIVQHAAGTHSLLSSGFETIKTMLRDPVAYAKSPTFLLMWAVYASTYSTANSLKTITEHREYYKSASDTEASRTTSDSQSKLTVFFGTASVNSACSLMKDQAYARMFGTTGAATKMPMITYGLWASRDAMVVGSSFILPDMLTKKLVEEHGMDTLEAKRFSQMSLPVATQFLAGPVQLLGLDFYNRPLANLTFGEAFVDRTKFLMRGFVSVVSARIARIAPGYGIGGVLNSEYRDAWRDHLIQKEIEALDGKSEESALNLVGLVWEKFRRFS